MAKKKVTPNLPALVEKPNCIVIPDTVEAREALIEDVKQRHSLFVEGALLKPLVTEYEAAAIFAVDVEWFRRRRKAGKEPQYYKIGDNPTGAVRYSTLTLALFQQSRLCYSTSQLLD